MSDPLELRVGDRVLFESVPDEWAEDGFTVHEESIDFMMHLIEQKKPVKVYEIDEYGQPWVEVVLCKDGDREEHTWAIMEKTGWKKIRE